MEGSFFPFNSASSVKDACRSTAKQHVDSFQEDLWIQSSCRGWETVEMSWGLGQPLAEVGYTGLKLLKRVFLGTCQNTEEFIMPRKITEMANTCTGTKTCLKRMCLWGENVTPFFLFSWGVIQLTSMFSSVWDYIFKNSQHLQDTQPPGTTGGCLGRMPQNILN